MNRKSGIELLRIVAMSMIVILHYLIHGKVVVEYPTLQYFLPVVRGGVDFFVLITGYFMINLKLRGVFKLALTIIVFQSISWAINYLFTGNLISWHGLLMQTLAPLSKSDYWFVNKYFCLMVLSPVLNAGLKNLTIQDLRKTVLLLAFVSFYSCWIFKSLIDVSNHRLFNFIFLYVLGYYLRNETLINKITNAKVLLISVVALFVDIVLNAVVLNAKIPFFLNGEVTEVTSFALIYHNPLLLVSHCALLILFSRFNFKSIAVNSMATAAFGVYLLQDGPCGQFFYNWQHNLWSQNNIYGGIILCVLLFAGYWVFSWIITSILRRIL